MAKKKKYEEEEDELLDPVDDDEEDDDEEDEDEDDDDYEEYPKKKSSSTKSRFNKNSNNLELVTGLFKNKGKSYGGRVLKTVKLDGIRLPAGTRLIMFKNKFDSGPTYRLFIAKDE